MPHAGEFGVGLGRRSTDAKRRKSRAVGGAGGAAAAVAWWHGGKRVGGNGFEWCVGPVGRRRGWELKRAWIVRRNRRWIDQSCSGMRSGRRRGLRNFAWRACRGSLTSCGGDDDARNAQTHFETTTLPFFANAKTMPVERRIVFGVAL